MLVTTRFRVPDGDADSFRTAADDLLGLLSGLPGFERGWLGRAPDDPALWVLATTWAGVGAYRRALSAYDVKMTAPAVMANAVQEPSAFEVLTALAPPEPTGVIGSAADR